MDARIDQLCDEIKAVIQAAMLPGAATVTVVDVPDVDRDTLSGRQVYVANAGYEDRGPATRGEDMTAYTIAVLVVERCPDDGPMPMDWRRERTAWVRDTVVGSIGDARQRIDGSYADTVTIAESREEQVERNLFWCEIGLTLMEIA